MKVYLRVVVISSLLGGVLTSWIAPKAIGWYFDPPAGFGVSCKDPIHWALSRYQWAQLVGMLVGIVLGTLIYFAFKRHFKTNGQTPLPEN